MKSFFGARNLNLKDAGLVAYRAASDLVGKGAFLLITVVAARRLTQGGFGVFSLASTVGWLAAIATDFGSQLHLARAIAREPRRASALLRGWTTFRLWTSAAAIAIVCGVVLAWPVARPYALAMVLLTATYIVGGLIEFLHYFYRGLSRSDLESTLTLAQRLATLALAAGVLWIHPSVTLLAAAMLVPVVATWLYSTKLAFSMASDTGERLGSVASEWVRDVMPIGAGIVLSALYFRVDVFLVEFWNGTEAVALYNAVFRLVEALRLFPAAVIAVALPVICRATNAKPLGQISTIVTVLAVLGSAVVAILAPWLVPFLYGLPYLPAVPAFRILLLA
ncbi:MAG TPA: oligosaccharide flippase family protein, partial [Vicinamibacterales bacterium]|nr:oligosaccharide flippase family protein [Vicinamibacterales bacterium]